MRNNIKIAIASILILLIGFVLGKYIFPSKQSPQGHIDISTHQQITESTNQIYTCSMHPQIRQNEPGLCPICEMDLIPLVSNTSNDPMILQMTKEAVKLANIQTTIVGNGMISGNKVQMTGKVQKDERMSSSLVAHIPGRIEELFVTFTGEKVSKGQKLASIYSPDLVTAQRELIEALKFKGANSSLVEAAKKKLEYWKIPMETIEEIESTGKYQETFIVYAEKSGTVEKRKVAVGDYVKTGEVLFDVIDLNRVWILFDAYEQDLPNIKIGDRVEFTSQAVPGRTFKTRVTFIDPVINPQTRVSLIRTELNNRAELLKPEMFVIGNLEAKVSGKAQLLVPKTAIMWTGPRSVVYVKVPVSDIPSFMYKEIELGQRTGDSYIVNSGLEPGEEVVTYGNFSIDAAAQLNNQSSMMNKNVTLKSEENATGPDYRAKTPQEFRDQLNLLAEEYIQLKDAFVATDANAAATASEKVLDFTSKVDMSLIKGEAHMFWMDQSNAIKAHSQRIIDSEDVEEQRKQFSFLSEALISSIEAFGISGETLYVQHCPMAFDNEGADWIAAEEQIRNPYFGDKMMKCGTVKGHLSMPMMMMDPQNSNSSKTHNH